MSIELRKIKGASTLYPLSGAAPFETNFLAPVRFAMTKGTLDRLCEQRSLPTQPQSGLAVQGSRASSWIRGSGVMSGQP